VAQAGRVAKGNSVVSARSQVSVVRSSNGLPNAPIVEYQVWSWWETDNVGADGLMQRYIVV
jgi:hypothetical protein